ncbi:MAG: amidohydrolase [Candidatus Rokuibacteriota bacterium]|nr:MAG: amidohydrolase [Candidatus Rokubacteria bacterium]
MPRLPAGTRRVIGRVVRRPAMTARGSLLALATMLLLVGDPRLAAAPYPLFDAHIHYSRPDWDAYPPERALALLARAGVRRAIVSSTPDDGTLKLYERAPTVVVPFLRPYRTREDMAGWHADAGVAAYVEERLRRGVYRGIGEFHLGAAGVDAPVVRRIAELAAERDLFLHAHVDADTIEKLLARYPKVRFLWAHAGMSADAETVGRLLDRFARLWVELALRSDVAPGGRLDPAWRARFLRHADRFLVGTDTWVTSRWEAVEPSMRDVQQWLAELPAEVAERIAWKNGARLFPAP